MIVLDIVGEPNKAKRTAQMIADHFRKAGVRATIGVDFEAEYSICLAETCEQISIIEGYKQIIIEIGGKHDFHGLSHVTLAYYEDDNLMNYIIGRAVQGISIL